MTGLRAIRATFLACLLLALPSPVTACQSYPGDAWAPAGWAGCERWGDGTASHYGPGTGVAMNFCTFAVRHTVGCGMVEIQSHQTGLVVTVAVVDYCQCHFFTADERIVDLQYSVVAALGLRLEDGLYPVSVRRVGVVVPAVLPDTSTLERLFDYNGITEGESVDAIESHGPGRRTHPTFGRGFALLEGESR